MDIESFRCICMEFSCVTEDIKWGQNLVFSVGGKMFCIAGLDQSPINASFKVPDEEFEEMSRRPGFRPAPYLAKHKWVLIEDIAKMKNTDWKKYLRQSYALVRDKLPAKVKNQLKDKTGK